MVEKNATNILEVPTEVHTAAPDAAAGGATFSPPVSDGDVAATELRETADSTETVGGVSPTDMADATGIAETAETPAVVPIAPPLTAPVRRHGFRYGCYLVVKRLFDIVSSFAALLLLSPVILIALLAKFLEDGHSPIYVSKRIGKNGKPFRFYKIRTMVPNADEMKQQLIDAGLNEADPPAFKMKNDPRITRVGRVLRKFSIDELPQLFNIFIGKMSVIGPRPPLPREVRQYDEIQMHRLDVKGGLLCFWQIRKNRNALSFDEWCRLDFAYIEKQSILLDLKILFRGAYMVLFDHSGE